jgi:hypothetical protein
VSEHVASEAAFLASLPEDDPERLAAEAHAEGCSSCRSALDEGACLIQRLANARLPPPPHLERLMASAALVEAELVRERRNVVALSAVVGGSVALSWIFQLSLDLSTASSAPARVALSLGVLLVAVIATLFARFHRRFVLAALIVTSALFARVAGSVAGLEPVIGAQCTLWEVTSAAIPWTVAVLVARRSPRAFRRAEMTAIAGGGALASQAAQHLTCPVWHDDAHLFIFHVGGVLLAMLLGALGPSVRKRAIPA